MLYTYMYNSKRLVLSMCIVYLQVFCVHTCRYSEILLLLCIIMLICMRRTLVRNDYETVAKPSPRLVRIFVKICAGGLRLRAWAEGLQVDVTTRACCSVRMRRDWECIKTSVCDTSAQETDTHCFKLPAARVEVCGLSLLSASWLYSQQPQLNQTAVNQGLEIRQSHSQVRKQYIAVQQFCTATRMLCVFLIQISDHV